MNDDADTRRGAIGLMAAAVGAPAIAGPIGPTTLRVGSQPAEFTPT